MMPTPAFILAQTQRQSIEILQWLGVLLVVAAVIAVAGLIARRLLLPRKDDDQAAVGAGFTLADLRQMHRDGQLTDEEFAAARGRMVAQSRAALRDDDPGDDRLSTSDAPVGSANAGEVPPRGPTEPDNPDDDETRPAGG